MTLLYRPYLLTEEEADMVLFLRAYRDSQRGSASPSDGTAAGPAMITFTFEASEIMAALSALREDLRLMSDAITTQATTQTDTFDAAFAKLLEVAQNQTTVIGSATVAFQGLVARLKDAEAHAIASGATPAQTAGIRQAIELYSGNTAALAAAMAANTAASDEAGADTNTGATGGTPAAGSDTGTNSGTPASSAEETNTGTNSGSSTGSTTDQPPSPEQGASPEQQVA